MSIDSQSKWRRSMQSLAEDAIKSGHPADVPLAVIYGEHGPWCLYVDGWCVPRDWEGCRRFREHAAAAAAAAE